MTWNIEFLEEAAKDIKRLDHSVRIQFLKGIQKVSRNPLPVQEGGYGKPLGSKSGTNLTNLLRLNSEIWGSVLYIRLFSMMEL